jgi:3(or 17)beta-hydroxysteroid dehydrogenase
LAHATEQPIYHKGNAAALSQLLVAGAPRIASIRLETLLAKETDMAITGFEGMVIVVTGGASGIGRRSAERLAEARATVVACDIANRDAPPGIISRRLDVTDESAWERTIGDVMRVHGRLDALVNAAGIILMGNVVDISLADFRRTMAVNVEGTFLGMKYAMRAMSPRGTGSIVNLSSAAGLVGSAGVCAYCASKGAVRLMSKSAALEAIAAGTRIRVNSVCPGLTDTPMAEGIVTQMGGGIEARAQLHSAMPESRLASVDDVVDAIMFLLSDMSQFINGADLPVDNGLTAQ